MRTIEFKTIISNNRIEIPKHIQAELQIEDNAKVRVMMLFDDDDDDLKIKIIASEKFLNGYDTTDSIYDN